MPVDCVGLNVPQPLPVEFVQLAVHVTPFCVGSFSTLAMIDSDVPASIGEAA